ncbi:MAG TPA: hypothetical protein VJ476_01350 [Rhizomicrobium sp.]|nr:hypothetical protein [Rhizomicrobium sp.]
MAHSFDVTGLGNAIVDVLAPVDEQFLLDHAIAKGVMTLVDEHRAVRLHAALSQTREVAGGSGANAMAGFASLGGHGAFAGKVKHDRLGEAFRASLKPNSRHISPFSILAAMAMRSYEPRRSSWNVNSSVSNARLSVPNAPMEARCAIGSCTERSYGSQVSTRP